MHVVAGWRAALEQSQVQVGGGGLPWDGDALPERHALRGIDRVAVLVALV